MLRLGHAASLTRSSLRSVTASKSRSSTSLAPQNGLSSIITRAIRTRRPLTSALTISKPLSTSLQRYATQPDKPFDHIDKKHEEQVIQKKLEAHPEEVSATSSVHKVFGEKGVEKPEEDEDMLAGVKQDFVCNRRLDVSTNMADRQPANNQRHIRSR